MRKKILGALGAIVFCLFFTGCDTIQSYSIRSYQGPLPMEDYRFINPEAYGVPVVTR